MASNVKHLLSFLCLLASLAILFFAKTIAPETSSTTEHIRFETLQIPQQAKKEKCIFNAKENLTLVVNSYGQYDRDKLQKVMMQNYFEYKSQIKTKAVPMQNCKCTRKIEVPPDAWYSTSVSTDGLSYNMANTTCSRDAFYRGSGQKIVGFTFYGNTTLTSPDGYYKGIAENLHIMRTYYPGWTMRLYYDLDQDHPAINKETNVPTICTFNFYCWFFGAIRSNWSLTIPLENCPINKTLPPIIYSKKSRDIVEICTLACSDSILDLCHVGQLPGTPVENATAVFPRIWRFFPLLDPQVDILVSRDLDSRFSWRESSAVANWLQASDEPNHVMRDHHCGHNTNMLAGMWGVHLLRKSARKIYRQIWNSWFKTAYAWTDRVFKNADQGALREFVWPWLSKNVLQHDAYTCGKWNGSVPFPTKRVMEINNHIGCRENFQNVYWRTCPTVCRPKDHQDWETC